ncbi:MAG: hypothetical protein AB7W16_12440 [Candidatus Obscuribacterales bacterium]
MIRKVAGILLYGFFALAVILALASFLGRFDTRCEILSHLRPIFLIGFALISLALLPTRNKAAIALALLVLVGNALPVISLYLPAKAGSNKCSGRSELSGRQDCRAH